MIKNLYKQARKLYLQRLRRYKEQGYTVPQAPKIPKRITKNSIGSIEKLNKKLTTLIHDQKVETGYFTRKREEARAKRAIKKAALKPAAKKRKKQYKKAPFTAPTHKPKAAKTISQPPALSDAVLRTFESEMHIATQFIAKSQPYQNAVREAGREAQDHFSIEINDILNKYIPDITKQDVRVAVAESLNKNYYTHMEELNTWLYEFISDGQGSLIHTDIGIACIDSLLKAVNEAEISIEDKKRLTELLNNIPEGEELTGDVDGEDW